MKRIRCKSKLARTVAKNGSNMMNGKHIRAAQKRAKKRAKRSADR